AIRRVGRGCVRLVLEAEQELRTHEDSANPHFDARFEAATARALAIERQGILQIHIRYGPAICAARECGDDSLCARSFFRLSFWTAHKQTLAARRILCGRRVRRVWTSDRHARDFWLAAGVVAEVSRPEARLKNVLEHRARLLNEIHLHQMRTG